ncbi:FkbM family methyltransferase [Ichthyenterobacterium sp. W332]|uniref:FkbM family methyltransferase n=1 Tax=Microcosmobacter mediterraneus TaxID=3075607 RepID=A0ABU2YMX1_9FLAO|nr:FkbM family methyltransferase [Ichthyenterobacterium sp. W332]MDT0559519.1 FkbM family methyltransferase [Ichthyenterobacterium sp. W332]
MNKAFKYFKKNKKSKKRKAILGPHAQGVIYNTENGIIALPIEDIGIGKSLGFNGNWDMEEINILSEYISKDDVVYVIGTHVGTLLIPMAKQVKEVIGYEANENTFWYMEMNLCMNRLKNVQLFNYAVGDTNKMVTFYQNTVNSGGSKIAPQKDNIMYNHDNPDKVEVQMIALDEHITQQNLSQPNAMLMDIEGAEYYALKGMPNTLSKLKFLYIEYVPHHLKNVSNISNEQFLEGITPHFTKANFVRNKKVITYNSDSSEVLNYLNNLTAANETDDILFSK